MAKDLHADDYETIRAVIESYVGLTSLVGDKNTTIQRLRKMLFGASTEKAASGSDRFSASGMLS